MKKIPISILKLAVVLLVTVPFVAVWSSYYAPLTVTVKSRQVSALLITMYVMFYFYFASRLDGFRATTKKAGELVFSHVIAVGVTNVITAMTIWMLSDGFPNLLPGFICFLVQCGVITICCFGFMKIFYATHPPKKSAVIYDVRQGMEDLITAYGLEKRFDVQCSYPVEDIIGAADLTMEQQNRRLDQYLNGVSDVFMCGVHTHERNIILKYCVSTDKRVYIIPRVGDVIMSGAERMHMFHLPFLRVTRYDPPTEYKIMKRVFDITVSGIGMILLSPLFLLIALLVKSDGGPALYKQVRLTKDRKEFKILKFRSMRVDAEKHSGAVVSAGNKDDRVTRVGRILRASHLDEMPQLWNIFVGDMSIVGPRPERPEIAEVYEKELPEFTLRLQCKAGLTGYAQVYGKYNTDPYDKLLMDLMYIANPSFLEDITIMLATFKTMFSKESTEGFGDEKVELKYGIRNKEL